MLLSTFTFANWTMAVTTAMISAREKEITVRGMVMVSPGSRIFGKESSRIPSSR